MLAEQVRSGLVETSHHGVVCVVGPGGEVLASAGDIERPFYLRSAAKPFQAFVSQSLGAELTPLEMALACGSHRGFPVHIAIVRSMLARAGLDESALLCPHDWPLAGAAADQLIAAGAKAKRRIWHNCSGKHAAFLRACVAQGWPVDNYLSPEHPLQLAVVEFIGDVGDLSVEPVGIDGCGAPVPRTNSLAMATMFARLASDDRFTEVRGAMQRYPALVGANGEGDSDIAAAIGAAAKGGAAGCVGVSVEGRLGLAVKSWDGSHSIANSAAANALDILGVLTPASRSQLADLLRPALLGGGSVVGHLETRLELT